MFFDKLSSIYEIFAASNIASIVSEKFNEAIENKILMSYDKVKAHNEDVGSKIEVASTSILTISNSERIKPEVKSEVSQGFSSLNDKYNNLKERITKKNYTQSISDFIPHISIFCTIYTIILLIFSGFNCEDNVSNLCWNSLLFINICCLLFILYITLKERIISYHWAILWLLLFYLGGFLFWLICNESYLVFPTGRRFLIDITIITSLVIPVLHYIVFITKAMIISKTESKKLEKELLEFEDEFDTFHKEQIEKKLIALNNIDIFNPQP